ncbi:MAG TPA: PAS domain S-box protein [Acetobacteraceae bacterium]|nr:PAS domain S-box protein [Acetobacteraceae bacterium]
MASIASILTTFVDPSGFTPHGFCLAWDPGLVWLQAGSDLAIAAAYYSIPLALAFFVSRREDLAFRWVFLLFAAFIMACGTTHVMGVLTLWVPAYWADGAVKAVTAILSCVTAVALWPLMPKALALPPPAQLRSANQELDATARRLAASEARYRALFTRAPVAMHTLDSNGRIVAVTDQWLDLLGYSREDVLGQPVTRFQDPETAEVTSSAWQGVPSMIGVRNLPRRFLRRSGEPIEASVSFTVETEPDGTWYVIASITDVTARKRAETALRASEDRLRQAEKLEAVGQLTSGIAHDFNNMLTVIMGSMDMLKRRIAGNEAAERLVQAAQEGAEKAARLTSQLLSFSRRQRLEPQKLNASEVVAGMEALLTRSVGERISLEIEPRPSDQWWCVADRNQLEAALLNLVLNARAAIAAAGRVRIFTRNLTVTESEAIEQGEPAPGDYLCISVEDNGSGMSDEVRRRAFEPFFTTKPQGQGSGLGLAQIYGFARQSGGTARIDSTLGVGTRVDLLLPRTTPPADAERTGDTVPANAPRGAGERILVVEDEAPVRELVAAALQESGYAVEQAADAEVALQILERGAPIDLLFTDIAMPGRLNGVELALEARRMRPGLPVLFATGYSDRAVLSRWPGSIQMLAKPYAPETLAAKLRACLDARRAPPGRADGARVQAR